MAALAPRSFAFARRIDSRTVREMAWAFRQRTPCADDRLVIEMLGELDCSDIWDLEKCFQLRLLYIWNRGTLTRCGHGRL